MRCPTCFRRTIADVLRATARVWGNCTAEDLVGPSQEHRCSRPRHAAVLLLAEAGVSMTVIGDALNRSWAAIDYARGAASSRRMTDQAMRAKWALLVQQFHEPICSCTSSQVAVRKIATAPLRAAESPSKRESRQSEVDADAYLEHAVAMECAPPWIRHPQPTT